MPTTQQSRFTVTVKKAMGRPQVQKVVNPAIAWMIFAESVRQHPDAEVTLHDNLYDVEVSG